MIRRKIKHKKRKPDLRRIRTTETYTLQKIADDLGNCIGTVRRWRREGLPSIDENKPTLIYGEVLKNWLKERWAARKHKCLTNEFFCLKCRSPRTARTGSVSIRHRNTKTLTIMALCGTCGTRMNKSGSLARLAEIQATFETLMPDKQHIEGCDKHSVKRMFSAPSTPADQNR